MSCLGRLLGVLAAVAVVAAVAWAVLPPFRAGVRAAALVPELIGLPIRPLSAMAPSPSRLTTRYGGERPDRLDLYVPAGTPSDRAAPAVVLELGVHPQPLDHPDVVGVATAIARLGVVVGVPDSTSLRQTRIAPDEPARLADAVLVVAARPEVDPGRVGLAGFSAGASVALLAGAEPALDGRLRWISAYGGYADAATLLVDVASRSAVVQDGVVAWAPEPGVRRDVLRLLLAEISPAERDRLHALLDPVVASGAPPAGPDRSVVEMLEGDARVAYELFTAAHRRDAEAALRRASPRVRLRLTEMSPLAVLGGIDAPVYLMHGLGDTSIPASHALALVRDLPQERLARATFFGRFGHIQPGRDGLGLADVPDIGRLTVHLHAIVMAATE